MIALLVSLGAVVVILGVALTFSRAAARRAVDREARALAESFAREAKEAARKKAEAAAERAVNVLEVATHEELERIARRLARRD